MKATPIYRSIMLEVERRRVSLGLPMEKFSEWAGLPERYYGKALSCDSDSGRQAQWSTLQTMIDALFPHGFDLVIRARPGEVISADNLKAKLLQLRALKDHRTQRELMGQLGRAGRAQQLANQTQKTRSRIARTAAKARWRKPRLIEITPCPPGQTQKPPI